MPKGRWLAAAAALMLTGAGCGLITINGKPLGSRSGKASRGEARPEAVPGEVGRAAPGADPDLVSLYRSLDYTCCTDEAVRSKGYSSVDASWVFNEAGVPIKSVRGPNPDPSRFPGWDDFDARTKAYAVVLAAINRTWTPVCHEDFAAYRAGWKAVEGEVRPRLDSLAEDAGHYERVEEIRALWELVAQRAKEQDLDLPKEHPSRWGGIRFELLQAYFDLHRQRPSMTPLADSSTVQSFRAHGHPWGDESLERDQYCAYARLYGTPTMQPYSAAGSLDPALLVLPSWAAREPEIEQRLSSSSQAAAEALQHERVDPNRISLQLINPTVGAKVYVGGADHGNDALYEVDAVDRKGTMTTIRASYERHSKRRSGCRRTNRVHRVHADGTVEYEELCTFTPYVTEFQVTLVVDDLPRDRVRKGDRISAYATLTKSKPSPGGGRKKRYVNRFTAKEVHLDRVVRDGELVHQH